jgi:hypothetical protein
VKNQLKWAQNYIFEKNNYLKAIDADEEALIGDGLYDLAKAIVADGEKSLEPNHINPVVLMRTQADKHWEKAVEGLTRTDYPRMDESSSGKGEK